VNLFLTYLLYYYIYCNRNTTLKLKQGTNTLTVGLKLQMYELLAKPSTGVLSLHYYITGEATSTLRRKRYMRKLEKEKGSKNLLKSIYDLGDGLPRVT
jgi:hypothetical protein